MMMQTNIDEVRAEIMRLEAAPHFDAAAWSRVLADLSAAGRVAGLADAQRRMETARSNQPAVAVETPDAAYFVGIDLATGEDRTVKRITTPTARGNGKSTFHADIVSLKAYWVQAQYDEWGMWIHAESAGKAKSIYHQQDPSLEPADFTELRALRPWRGAETLLDITPFTDGTLALAGYPVDTDEFPDSFLEFCPCSMCKAERLKPTYRMSINNLVEA